MITVSVICLSYNQADYILESLESLSKQDFRDFEILICDDGSIDNSVEIINSWIDANDSIPTRLIVHQENKGICFSLNELLNESKGQYVQLLALDDVLEPTKLSRQVQLLSTIDKKYSMLFSDAYLMDGSSKKFSNLFIAFNYHYLDISSGNFYNKLVHQNFIPAMSALIKKEYLEKVGGWDEELKYEDYDMWLRLSQISDFYFDDFISCSYRLHNNNTHAKAHIIEHSLFKILLKHRDNEVMQRRLFQQMELAYLKKQIKEEVKLYYSSFKCKSLEDFFIKYNFPTTMYRVLKLFRRL